MLTNRQQILLTTIVEDFVESGQPVGSKTLLDQHHLSVSAATVRAEMKRLEDYGYIEKTHSSSGRKPSLNGYRYYVDQLKQHVDKRAVISSDDYKQLAAQIASDTQYVTVISGRKIHHRLSHVHLTTINGYMMVVLIYEDGHIKHKELPWRNPITALQITRLNDYLNSQLQLADQLPLHFLFQSDEFKDFPLLKLKSLLINEQQMSSEIIYIAGKEFVFESLANDGLEVIKDILSFLDSEQLAVKLNSMKDESINVKIGQEIDQRLNNVSLVTIPVEMTAFLGTLAVLGPIHMSYKKVFDEFKAL